MTNTIAPEGDEYNARRQEELHAAVANKATMTRRMSEMIRDGAPADQISAVIDVIAQLDREIPHIGKDLAVSVQGRNLSIFLGRMEEALAANAAQMAQLLKEKADADTDILAGINNNLTLYNLTLEQVLAVSHANEAQLAQFQQELEGLRQGQFTYNERLDDVVVRLDRKREEIDVLKEQMHELHGDFTPEQRQRYIDILMRMIAEWEAAHPDV